MLSSKCKRKERQREYMSSRYARLKSLRCLKNLGWNAWNCSYRVASDEKQYCFGNFCHGLKVLRLDEDLSRLRVLQQRFACLLPLSQVQWKSYVQNPLALRKNIASSILFFSLSVDNLSPETMIYYSVKYDCTFYLYLLSSLHKPFRRYLFM